MQLKIHTIGTIPVVSLTDTCTVIHSVQDALDLMADARHLHNCEHILVLKEHLPERFFDLSTGLAGEILQKYVNYGVKLAIVGDFSGYTSKALQDFIRESNRGSHVFFLSTREEALAALSQ